jgi:glycosyltransferase involved in cell wall biosynthesis
MSRVCLPHVLQVFERPTGGVPTYVAGLCEGLVARGWRVSVFCPEGTAVDARLARSGVEKLPHGSALELARTVRSGDIELVHAHSSRAGPLGALVAEVSRRPLIYTPHGWSFEMRVSRRRRILYGVVELMLTRALRRRVIAVAGDERSAAERWHVAPFDRIAVVPTGIPAPERIYRRASARARLRLSPAEVIVAWVGRDADQKRPQDLADVASGLRACGARVVVLGAGMRSSAAGRALEASGGVILDEDTDPQVLYAAADILVQTSAWEGMPIALLEAMTASLPVVAYDVGGVRELVLNDETGYRVPVGDVAALNARLERLASNEALRHGLGHAARRHVAANHSYDRFLDGIEHEYRRSISAWSAARKGELHGE